MGRTSIALGAPDSDSGIMDGFVTATHFFNKQSSRSSPLGVDRVGQTLPQLEEPTSQQQHAHQADKEVARGQLWFQLSVDERTQFGNCFSRMLLKCLNGTKQEEQEIGR